MHLPPGEELTSNTRTYTIVRHIAAGAIADIYLADSLDGQYALKVGNDKPGSDDRVSDEALTIAHLVREGDPKLRPFLPTLHDAFAHDVTWVNVFEYLDGWYTLDEVHARYPELDPKDWAWMWRRLLAIAGFASRSGVAHGAITPDNVFIHPEMHGLKLIDWAQAKMVEPTDRSNVEQAISVAVYLLGGDPAKITFPDSTPQQLRSFIVNANRLGSDPWVMLEHLDGLLERMWGRRRFHPFTMA